MEDDNSRRIIDPVAAGATMEDDNARGIIDPVASGAPMEDDNARGIIGPVAAGAPMEDDNARGIIDTVAAGASMEDDNARGIISDGPAAHPIADDHRRQALHDTDYSVNGIGDGESSDCHQVHAGESSREDLYDKESSDDFDVYNLIGCDLRRALNFGEPSPSGGSHDLESSIPPSVEPPASDANPSLAYAAYYYDLFFPHLSPYPSSHCYPRYSISLSIAKELVRQSLLYYDTINLSAVMATSSCFLCSGRQILTHQVHEQPPCSRCFQEFLNGREPEITKKVLAGFLRCSVHEMMMNSRGSDFILKLLHVADDGQRNQMVDYVRKDHRMLLKVAKDPSGSECVKELVKIVKFPVGKALKNHVMQLMTCKNGKSVVDCCLEHLNYEANKVFIQAAVDSFKELAPDKCGCLALVSCMNYSMNPHRDLLLRKSTASALGLAYHIYGNYVVQCALNMNEAWAAETICVKVAGSLMELSVHKNGSYVVQRCLESSGRHHVIRALARLSLRELEDVLQHNYANYVLKTALASFKRGCPFHQKLLHRLERLVLPYKNHIHASNVYKCIMDIRKRSV